MKNITLNFFGEKVGIKMPTDLASLRQEISNKFMFSPSDAAEVIISYMKDLGKKIIQTEQDFSNFITNKIGKLDLDISQDSRLYIEQFNVIKKETEENKKLLEACLKKDEEIKKKKEEILKQEEAKLKEIEVKIEKLQKKKQNMEKKIKKEKILIEKEQKLNDKKIQNLKKKLGLIKPNKPTSPTQKKNVLKNVNPIKPKIHNKKENKEIHTFVTCDGCKMSPIIGKRYKCETCPNFDFCEKCYMTRNKEHGHSFKNVKAEDLMKEALKMLSKNNMINQAGKHVHYMISCNGCGVNHIIGKRFKCTQCENFNYCENCEKLYRNIHSHPMMEVSEK